MSEATPADSKSKPRPPVRRFSHRAMATIFEVLVAGLNESAARDAAEAALAEIDRMEKLLSRYKAYSDISRVNAAEPGQAVVLEVEAVECLQAAMEMWRLTGGAFDPTAGSADGGESAGKGMKRIALDDDAMTATRMDAGVRLDLGGIGKGYALDRAAEVLAEWGARDALLHGGASTLLAMGSRPDVEGWVADLRNPSDDSAVLGAVTLKDCSFSGSSTAHARHIIDPRTQQAVPADRAAWAIAEDAATADALTTALCVMSETEIKDFATANPKSAFILGRRGEGTWRLAEHGPKVLRPKTGNREPGTRGHKCSRQCPTDESARSDGESSGFAV